MRVYFIGIGGIGVSALAQYYLAKGCRVSGSDLSSSEITESLRKKGVKICIAGPNSGKKYGKNGPFQNFQADLVIYSPAVPPANPELKLARKKGIKCLSYPEALGNLTKNHFTLAVSGTHGKSTTTAMISLILIKAGLNPTVILGTKLKEFKDSNFRMGKKVSLSIPPFLPKDSRILLIEADEHFASFLNYRPKAAVLTNIERDHLDYYKNLGNILKAFKKYVSLLPEKGILIANEEDKNIKKVIKGRKGIILRFFSRKQKKDADNLRKILKVPGEHNVLNALAALTLARSFKIPDGVSFKALSGYKGCWRRFQIIKVLKPRVFTLVNDYGHHPTELKATIKGAREKWPKKRIWLIFQPHQYQRTFYFFNDFVKVFRELPADKIIITDVYDVAGRERKDLALKVNSKKLAEKIKREKVFYLPKEKLKEYLKKNLEKDQILIMMGAGDIYNLSKQL
jgi:UDP-N-acetylmuramate--alanine ligase